MSTQEAFFSLASKGGAYKRFPDGCVDFFESSDFSINCKSIDLLNVLSHGSFGVVYKGIMGGELFAVKLQDFTTGIEEQVNLIVELTILQSLPHDRMVRFYGAGFQLLPTGPKIMILMELCENGTLRDVLKLNLPWNLLVRLALDIARGIDFLHGQNIIHRDIKTTNVLINEFYRAKLCDFSFACHEECTSKKDFVYGTDEFMSPEVALALDFDKSSDIFSFGIILCELMTCKEPSSKFLNRKAQNLFSLDETQLTEFIIKGCPEELEALACQCCDVDQTKRPTAQTCIEELVSMLLELGGSDIDYVPSSDLSHSLLMSESYNTTDLSTTGVFPPQFCPMAEMEARFSLLDSQMKELRAENSRLTNDVSTFSQMMFEREEDESSHFELKTPLSVLSSTGCRKNPLRVTPSKFGSNTDMSIDNMTCRSTRISSHEKSISRGWTEANPIFSSPIDRLFSPQGDERINESSGESKISHTMLLQQLTSIQSQLDIIKKQLTGSPTRRSVSNPFTSDSPIRNFTSPMPLHPSTTKSTSHFSATLPASTSIPLNFPSDEIPIRTPPRIEDYPSYKNSDFERDTGETVWISNPLSNTDKSAPIGTASRSESRFTYPASERIVRVKSRKFIEENESDKGLITAASRCRDIANRDPANDDLSSALNKYLNVVKKLTSSASKLDSRLDKDRRSYTDDSSKNASDFFKPIFL